MKILIIFILTAYAYMDTYKHEFTSLPQAGECYPSDPATKEYHETWGFWLYETKIISCEYTCLDHQSRKHYLRGTQKIRAYFGERGDEFVCKGFEKDMKWVETPHSSDRWGYYTLGKTRPFSARHSDMPEIKEWFEEHFSL